MLVGFNRWSIVSYFAHNSMRLHDSGTHPLCTLLKHTRLQSFTFHASAAANAIMLAQTLLNTQELQQQQQQEKAPSNTLSPEITKHISCGPVWTLPRTANLGD